MSTSTSGEQRKGWGREIGETKVGRVKERDNDKSVRGQRGRMEERRRVKRGMRS